MTNLKLWFGGFGAIAAAIILAGPSTSLAQTFYPSSSIVGQPVMNSSVGIPIGGSQIVSTPWVNSAPVVSSYPAAGVPIASPVYSPAPVVSPSTVMSWHGNSGYVTLPTPNTYRGQQVLSTLPSESFDGQTLHLSYPNGMTLQRRTALGQAWYYQSRNDRIERAYTGETRAQQDERQYRDASRQWRARTQQALPNNPLLRLGANIFLGPPQPASMQRGR